jgi:hypothetical protein
MPPIQASAGRVATDDSDAIRQALEDCHVKNDREPYDHLDDIHPKAAKLEVAEIDLRRFAGPLVHWARSTGNSESPIWKMMELAVVAAELDVGPSELIGGV